MNASLRIRELDGVRALAIWGVLSAHYLFTPSLIPIPPTIIAHIPHPLYILAAHGWLGVDLFFLLSGFLITGILLDDAGKEGFFRKFYERRARRILPLALLVGGILFLAYGPRFHAYFALCALFAANFHDYLGVPAPRGAAQYWSLSIEEQFYCIWPFLVLQLSRRALVVTAVALVVGEPFYRLWASLAGIHGFFSFTWAHSDGLALGALIAVWFRSPVLTRKRSLFFAAALMGTAMLITLLGLPFGIEHQGVVGDALRVTQADFAFGALIVFAIAGAERSVTAPLRSRVMRITADFSYCIYLIHLPLAELYVRRIVPAFPQLATLSPTLQAIVQLSFLLTACYLLAGFSRRYIELPILQRSTPR